MKPTAVIVRNPSAWSCHRETFSGEEFIDFGLCGIDPDQGRRPEQRASDWAVVGLLLRPVVWLGLAVRAVGRWLTRSRS